ncbi:fibronectin type III domain-containing protein [Flavobacterium sp.]|uniref:Ig-like domain-containing protein n=1 Tax=Flavobacterium sp. TaxID=239 RepID=UPI0025C4BBA6|nr:fibronectin type III domain-containing protein [Flavobacterium sp.]
MKSWLFSLVIAVFCLAQNSAFAQVSGYTFSSSSSTYTPITGGTNTASTSALALDDNVYSALPIGFTFNYSGTDYTTFGINANGWISMGSTAPVSSTTPISSGSTNNVISAFGVDLIARQHFVVNRTSGSPTLTVTAGNTANLAIGATLSGTGIASGATVTAVTATTITMSANASSAGTGSHLRAWESDYGIRYQTTGTAPNRKLVVQFTGFSRYTTSLAYGDEMNFQIVLNETSNAINLVYSWPTPSSTTSTGGEVGLRGSSTSAFNNRTTTTSWASTTAGTTNSATIPISSTVAPANGLTYSFTPPSCAAPVVITASATTPTTSTISWSAANPVPSSGYEYEVRTSGAAGSGATGLSASGATTSLTANVTGLTPGATHSIYVRSVCGTGVYSGWSAATTFVAPCASITSLPWNENFDAMSTIGNGVLPSCWVTQGGLSSSYMHTTQNAASQTYNDPRSTPNYVTIYYPSTTAYLWSPPFQLTAGTSYDFSFYWVGDGTSGWVGDVLVNSATSATGATALGSSFVAAAATTTSTYAKTTRTFVPGTTGTYYFAIRSLASSSAPYYMGFDDFNLKLSPTCIEPTALTSSAVTNNGATISWTAPTSAPANGYEYYYATTNAEPSVSATPSGSTAAGVTSASLGSLNANTTYYYWVRSVCSTSDKSIWTVVSSFTTLCNPLTAFNENFDTQTTPNLPSCWSKIIRGTSSSLQYVTVGTSTSPVASAPNAVGLYNSGTGATEDIILVSPYVSNLAAGTHRLRFKAICSTASQDIIVGTLDTSGASAVFTPLQTVDVTASWQEFIVPFNGYTGTNKFIALKRVNTSTYTTVYVDDVVWELTPTCYPPTAVTTSNMTTTGVTLNWTAPSQGSPATYFYEVRSSGAAGSGATGLVASGNVNAPALTATANGLSANTSYSVYIRTFCGGTDYSAWSTAMTFTTPCASLDLPYAENFESVTVPALPTCTTVQNVGTGNAWVTASPAAYGFTSKALRYSWNTSNAANVWWYTRGLNLTAGVSYTISYKYGSSSTTYVEKLKVAYGNSPVASAMTNVIGDYPNLNTATPSTASVVFVPQTSGVFYFGFQAYSAANQFYLIVDDISVIVTPPTITSFAPTAVCNGGSVAERTVMITGTHFTGATAVSFNGTAAASFVVNSDTQISAVVPVNATTGTIVVSSAVASGTSSASLTVGVTPSVNPIQNGNATLCVQGTVQMSNTSPGGVWASSNTAVATVTQDGLVTATGAGTATITYSVTDLGCTGHADTTVTVNAPITSTNPTTQTVVTGSNTSFSVTASGAITGYQWMVSTDGGDVFENVVDGAPYSGATTNTLTITNTPDTFNENMYMVVISAAAPCAAFESAAATLNVGDTGITQDPAGVTLCTSGNGQAVFTVVPSGTVTSYTWQVDSGLGYVTIANGASGNLTYSGATTAQLTVDGINFSNSGLNFRVIVTGPANGATSNPASLTVNQGIAINTQPAGSSTCYSSGSTTFSVDASGGVASYQWQYSANGITFSNVVNGTPAGATYTNATTATLTVATTASTPAAGTYFYRAVIGANAPCAAVTSDAAQLTIFTPQFTSQPAAATVLAANGGSAVFTAATSAPAPTYQWVYATTAGGTYSPVVNGTPAGVSYSGADSASLTVNATSAAAPSTARYYKVIVTSGGCSVTSNSAQLTIRNYCIPAMTTVSASGDYINNFNFANIANNNSGDTATDYTYYSNLTANVYAGQSYPVSLTAGGTTSIGAQQFRVWIDFNQDGDFEDAGESVFATTTATFAPTNATGTIAIPAFSANVLQGVTRMRVASRYNTVVGATAYCTGQSAYGEYEDYNVNIQAVPACSGTPVAGTVSASVSSICQSGTSILTATGFTTPDAGISFQWYNTATGLIAGATNATFTTPTLTASASYFVRVTCANSGLSSDSNTVNITVTNPVVEATTPGVRCGAGTVLLSATPSAGTSLAWYAAQTGGTALAFGNTFTTPSISTTTNYYVAAQAMGAGIASIGAGATTGTGAPYDFANGTYGGVKSQYLFTAAELSAAGLRPGTLSSIAFEFTTVGSALQGLTVQMGNTSLTNFPSPANIQGGLSTVVNSVTFTPAVGVNMLNFNNNFTWDGTSNVIVSVSWSNNNTVNTSATIKYDTTTGNRSQSYRQDNVTSATMLAFTGATAGAGGTSIFDVGATRAKIAFGASNVVTCISSRTVVAATVNTAPALTISSSSATLCSGTSSSLVTLTSPIANYDNYVWTPATGVTGNTTSGWTFNPSVSTAYTLTATQTGGSQCANSATFTVTVNAAPADPVITPANTTVCAGGITPLTVGVSTAAATAIFGNGTTSPSTTSYPNPLSAYYGGTKTQILFTASELTAQGLSAGSAIGSLSFDVSATATAGTLANFTIRMGTTSASALTGIVGGTTAVYGPTNFTPSATGIVSFTLATPYVWDGTSNVIVETVHNAGNGGNGTGTTTRTTTTTANTVFTVAKDNVANGIAGFDAEATYSISAASALRPNMRFGLVPATVTWAPTTGLYTDSAATIAYTGGSTGTVYAKPTASATYTATVSNFVGCSKTSAPATITVNQFYNFYADADGDGYGVGSPVSLCAASASAAPTGYAVLDGDCDDTIAAINPGHAEVPYNGIDDNCNGTIDEGSQLLSQVLPTQCGTTLASISSVIGAVSFGAPVDGYRFRVVNTTTNAVQVFSTNVPHFQLSQLAVYDYATTYSISVMLRRNGIWLNYYGTSCLVSTPAILDPGGSAAVNPSQCGITLSSISTLIATTSIPNVSAYRFRVTNLTDGTAPYVTQELERTTNWFALTMLTRFNYGTQYQVEVSVKTNGSWSGYGAPCNVSSPIVPTLTNCGATIATAGTLVTTTSLNRASAYRFEITNMSTFVQTTIDRSNNYFSFNNVPGYTPGTVYAVRVAIQTSGYWSPFGEACSVTSPGAAKTVVKGEEQQQPAIDFRAVAYPNPYVEGFAIDMDTPSAEKVQVKVYDMVGKLLEDREYPVDVIETQQFGERYPSGVYNVVVTQAGFVKTLRVIKR